MSVGIRDIFHRLSARPEELDDEQLREFCASHTEATPIGEVGDREDVTVIGEVASVRLTSDDAPRIEITLSDGKDRLVAVWTGRSRIAGIDPGRRLILTGTASSTGPGGRMALMNPGYELL